MGTQDLILSMVPEGSHVRSVYLTPETGVLAAQDLGEKILIDCSTIDTGTSLQVAEECGKKHPKARFYGTEDDSNPRRSPSKPRC